MAISGARQIKNVATADSWMLEVTGFNPFLVHKVKLPKKEFEIIERKGGGQTIPVQQSGPIKALKWSFEAWIPTVGEERAFLWNWNEECKTRDTTKTYKDVTITLIGPNDDPIMRWRIEDAMLPVLEYEEFESSADNKKLLNIKCECTCNDVLQESV